MHRFSLACLTLCVALVVLLPLGRVEAASDWPSNNILDYPDRMTQEGITAAGKVLTPGEVEKLFGAPLKESVAKMAWVIVQSDGDDSFRIAEVEGKTSIWNVAVALSRGQPRKTSGGLWSVLAIPRKVIGAPLIGVGGSHGYSPEVHQTARLHHSARVSLWS